MSDMMDYEDEEVGVEPTSNEPWTPKKRMRFSTDRDVNRDTPDNSVKAAELFLSQRNPELYQDHAAVSLSNQAKEMGKARGKADTFGNKLEASVMQLNTFINSSQAGDLEAARKSKHKMEYSHAELTDGVPPEFILPLMDERNNYGDVAALVLKQQIQEDVANNTILDNLEWYSAIGYGVLQAVVDPTTYIGGAVGYKAGASMSKVANKATQYLGKSVPKVADDLTRWASASTVEAALTNAPRLGGDHTYKPEDYLTDVMVDAVVGTGLTFGASQLLKGAGVLGTKLEQRRATQREAIEAMNREVETGKPVNADTNAWKHIAPESEYMDKPFAKVTDDVVRTHAYRYDVSGSEWNQFTPGETVLKIDQMIESKAFKIDNDMQWLALEAKDLAVQVELLSKFRNKVDLSSLQSHPAINNPTKANVVDMVRKLQAARDKAGDIAGKQVAIDGAGQVKFPEVPMMNRPKLRDLRYTKYDSKRLGMFARLNDELAAKVEGLDMVQNKGEGWDTLTGIVHDAVRLHQGGVNVESLLSRLMRNDVFMNTSPERYAKYVQGARAELDKVMTYANKRGNDSKVPSPLSEEMSAVLAKFDAEVASARLRRESMVKNPVTQIEYPSVMEVSKYPVQSKELKATVDLAAKQDVAEEVPQPKYVETDEVSAVELEEVAKRLDAEQKAEAEAAPEGAEPKKMLQFTDVTNLDSAAIREVSKGLMKDNWNAVTAMIANYHGSGEHKVYQDLLRPASIGQFAAKAVSQWGGVTKDLATKFIESDNPALNWIGTHFTEMGRGYGGDVMRKHTAAVIREAEYVRSVSKVLPHYDKAVKEYAASKGANAVQEMMAAVSIGGKNKLQDEFSRKLMLYLNAKRLGKSLPNEPIIAKFAQQWDDYMLHNYTALVDNHIKGFTGMNRIQHYAPQIWKVEHAKRMMRDGVDLLPLLQKAMRTENPIEDAKALEAWLKSDDAMGDMYVATNDARSVERLNVDWSAEHDGVSLLDLIETDTRKLATNYSNRVAGWAGVSKASGGNINSYTALHTLQKAAFEHNKDPHDFQVVGDVIDMLFGRPVQGGLADWQRSLKTASVLTKLGGLGSAQLIETSAVAARSIMESTGDPQFMKKVLKGMNPDEMAEDLRELQNLTGYNWDYHLINVESEYYTDYDLAQTSRVRNAVDWAVDKATFGGLKPVVGRAFGHVTGYNMVRKYQEAMLQRSFAMQVARHFVLGKSKMSPKRMADYGLTDVNGVNDALAETIRKNVEFDADGYPTKYNFDKWEPKAKETFMYALQRAEATELLRPLVGEMPEWWNKPWVQMLMQFRTMPIAAQNKALGRSLAFADKEAAVQLALNCMTAGLVRHSKFALMAAVTVGVGDEWAEEYKKQVDRAGKDALLGGAADRYITQLGGIGDVYALSHLYGGAETPEQYVRKTMNQVPALSLVGSYVDAAYAASTGDGEKAMSHAERIIFLNNTMAFEATGAVIEAVAKGD